MQQAERSGAVIEMVSAVGDTLVDGSVVMRVHGDKVGLAEKDLIGLVHLETERTFEQDPKYPIRVLVDIAIKALSPAVNDPTTAVQAIDQIEDLPRCLMLASSEMKMGAAPHHSDADLGGLFDARFR